MYVSLLGIGFSSFVISSNDNNNLSFNASFGDVNDILLSQSFNNEITITPYGFYNDETFNLSVTLNCEVNLDIDKAREEITSFNNALSLNVSLSEKDNLVTNFIDPNKITVSFDKELDTLPRILGFKKFQLFQYPWTVPIVEPDTDKDEPDADEILLPWK